MMSRRRSTVHDAAALRLHPNGVRVNHVVQNVWRSATPATVKTPTHAQRTSRGNWIATDAGGHGRVTKRRKVSTGHSKDPNVGESIAAEAEDDADAGQLEEIPVKTYKDARAKRRVAFENDYSFLAVPTSIPERDTSHLQPSSDFIKCIHHFASQYYDSRGQLFDGARQNRKLKKQKRLRKLQAAASGSQDPNDSQNDGKDEGEHARSGFSNEELPVSQAKTEPKVKKRKSSRASEQSNRDMYKAFDGSALLCIGTLLQSYVCSSLADNVPNTWADDEDTYMSVQSADSDSGEMHPEQYEDGSGKAKVNRTKAEAMGVSTGTDTDTPSSEG